MAKFNFNLRDVKSNRETPINLVIRWSNKRLVYPTKISINPKFWDPEDQRAISTKKFPNYPNVNVKLGDLITRAEKTFIDIKNVPSLEHLRESLDIEFERTGIIEPEKHTLFSFIEKFISQAKNRVNEKTGKPLSKVTIYSAYQCLRLLKEFSAQSKKPLDFDSIDLDFFYDFKLFLTKKGFATNTIAGRISKLKWFLNGATETGVNTKLSYKSKKFAVNQVLTETIYLNEKELQELYNLDLSKNERLERVRDLFLVGCWTGLRFSDFSTLSKAKFEGEFIEITTQKTNETVIIPIYPVVSEIMNRYKGKTSNSLPRSLSNVKMNQYLKELGEMIDSLHDIVTIKTQNKGMEVTKDYKRYKLLTTHTARRSFATNLYKDGVKPQVIMKITGHRTETAFMRYIRVTPKENAESLLLHWKRKEGLKIVG